VIPLDAKKHTETPSIEGTDPACEKTAGDDYYSLTEFSNPVPNGGHVNVLLTMCFHFKLGRAKMKKVLNKISVVN